MPIVDEITVRWITAKSKKKTSSITFRSLFDHFDHFSITPNTIKKMTRKELINAIDLVKGDVSLNKNLLTYTLQELYSEYPALKQHCKTEADKQSAKRLVSNNCFVLINELIIFIFQWLRFKNKKLKESKKMLRPGTSPDTPQRPPLPRKLSRQSLWEETAIETRPELFFEKVLKQGYSLTCSVL